MRIAPISFAPLKINQQSPNFKGSSEVPEKPDAEKTDNTDELRARYEARKQHYLTEMITKRTYTPAASCEQAQTIAEEFLLPELAGKKINSLCDLGCGDGGPTVILANALDIPLENVTGVDNHPVNNPDFKEGEFVQQDLMDYLFETDKKFDMISLCRPNCFSYSRDAGDILNRANDCLTKDGYFFTYGENMAMDKVKEICELTEMQYSSKKYDIPSMPSNYSGYNLEAILIPASELKRVFG